MTQPEAEALLGYQVTPGWTFHEIKRSGELAGFVMQKGSEVHVKRLPEFDGRWGTRQDVERVMGGVIAEHGKATTMVRKSNLIGHRFVQRIGFVPVLDDGSVIHYECERLKHARL